MAFENSTALQSFLKTATNIGAVFVEQWEGTVQPPYIVVGQLSTDTIPADNTMYVSEKRFWIDVFVKKTDNTTPATVETALKEADIYFQNETFYNESLRLVCHEYEI